MRNITAGVIIYLIACGSGILIAVVFHIIMLWYIGRLL